MKITVSRFVSDDDTTISTIAVDGEVVCFGLEDEYREVKVAKETRIPAGTYAIKLRKVGGFHGRYQARYSWHQGMLEVQNVPGFEYILIHTGNTDEHTAGCLLTGESATITKGDMSIGMSRIAYAKLYAMVVEAAKEEKLLIEYTDND